MYYELMKLKTPMNMDEYSLKDLALYFEKYDGYVCKIETEERQIRFKIEVNSFPHLIGLQHAFKGQKAKNKYKGASGFEKIKNGELTYRDIMKAIKHNSVDKNNWTNIKNRIKYIPMFLNTISSNTTKLKVRDNNLINRNIFMNGNYFLYKSLNDNNYPMFSLKNINDERTIIETFIVDKDVSLLGALKTEKIKSIELISPLENTGPITIKIEEDATVCN